MRTLASSRPRSNMKLNPQDLEKITNLTLEHYPHRFYECARVLKPGGRLVLVDSLQHGDQPDCEGLLELFPQNYHEPYYVGYTNEDFSALATSCGLTHIRDVKAFVSKVMVFDKLAGRAPAVAGAEK